MTDYRPAGKALCASATRRAVLVGGLAGGAAALALPACRSSDRPLDAQVVVLGAGVSAALARLGAQLAGFLGERTLAGEQRGAGPAGRGAVDAAGGALVGALLPGHLREAVVAVGGAFEAGLDAVDVLHHRFGS